MTDNASTQVRLDAALDAYAHLLAVASWARWSRAQEREGGDAEDLSPLRHVRSRLGPRVAFYLALEARKVERRLARERDVALREAKRATHQLTVLRRQLDDERKLRLVQAKLEGAR